MRQSNDPLAFSTLQVLSDLHAAASDGFAGLAASLGTEFEPALHRVIFEQKCRLDAQDTGELHAELMMAASMPDQDHASFMTATIVLVSDRLQYGAGADDLFWNWTAFHDRYREADAPVRAALMNGFRLARKMSLVAFDQGPDGTDLHTYHEPDLIRLLRIVARSMTDDTRDSICALASSDTRSVHRTALGNCLKSNCLLTDFGSWFPREVVERGSLCPGHPGFSGCTALMILDAIDTKDQSGKMAYRYAEQAEDYARLTPDVRRPLLAGLRHLHEMDSTWEPYAEWPNEKRADKAIVMPFPRA